MLSQLHNSLWKYIKICPIIVKDLTNNFTKKNNSDLFSVPRTIRLNSCVKPEEIEIFSNPKGIHQLYYIDIILWNIIQFLWKRLPLRKQTKNMAFVKTTIYI